MLQASNSNLKYSRHVERQNHVKQKITLSKIFKLKNQLKRSRLSKHIDSLQLTDCSIPKNYKTAEAQCKWWTIIRLLVFFLEIILTLNLDDFMVYFIPVSLVAYFKLPDQVQFTFQLRLGDKSPRTMDWLVGSFV